MVDNPLNRYAVGIMDYQLDHNPLARRIKVHLMADPEPVPEDSPHFGDDSNLRDLYHDFVDQATGHPVHAKVNTVEKLAVVKKDHPLHYVQFQDTEELVEDTSNLPWTVSFTITGLPRIPRTDDLIEIPDEHGDYVLYAISLVAPAHRNLDGVITCTIYPEHTLTLEP